MNESLELDPCRSEGPLTELEHKLIEEYLQEKGYRYADLKSLPEDKAKSLLIDACRFVGLKLAEMEARAALHHRLGSPI